MCASLGLSVTLTMKNLEQEVAPSSPFDVQKSSLRSGTLSYERINMIFRVGRQELPFEIYALLIHLLVFLLYEHLQTLKSVNFFRSGCDAANGVTATLDSVLAFERFAIGSSISYKRILDLSIPTKNRFILPRSL